MQWECNVCGFIYDPEAEGTPWEELPDDWECPICGASKSDFVAQGEEGEKQPEVPESAPSEDRSLAQWARSSDEREEQMADIHRMAEKGESITEPMRAAVSVVSWNDILIKGGQLARLPLNADESVSTRTVIGPRAAHPLVLEMPVFVTHMSFGALSREVKLAMARGSAAAGTAMCSGEGGILPESMEAAHRYIFEYVPNRYSVSDENLRAADAIEIKMGQSAKPGMGGHLPGEKVTEEIAAIRGRAVGESITSPAHFPDIRNQEELKEKVVWLREASGGKPIGIKFAAGDVEADLEVALFAEPDYITIDGRPGATGAAPKYIKAATSVPTIFALCRARKAMDERGVNEVSLVITGGLRVSSDFAKALALGADAVAIGTAAMMACGCQQYRVCHTGKCPVGIATQDPDLRSRLDVEASARRLENYLEVCNEELRAFARLTGHDDIHDLSLSDVCTLSSEISGHTDIRHV